MLKLTHYQRLSAACAALDAVLNPPTAEDRENIEAVKRANKGGTTDG